MRTALVLLAVTLAGACHKDRAPDPQPTPTFDQCRGDAASFTRQAFLAIAGRRPKSQAEVDVYVDLFTAAETRGDDPRATVARAIANRPEVGERWVDLVMDALHVQRLDYQNEAACWDNALHAQVDPALATAVRDSRATAGGGSAFTMLDLARSALALDDLSPIYRAQIFSLVQHEIPAANVEDPAIAELARRADFGATFDSAYLHRDIVCLGCHTSSHSVTDNDDPALDRHWPAPGLPEDGVYGPSPISVASAHAMFRFDGSVSRHGSLRPWGWSEQCGSFAANVPDDVAGIDARFASIRGKRATVFDLEAALGRGFEALRGHGPTLDANGAIADPDAALAWLVTLKITEDVWRQATGTRLTIANYFPRNEAASKLLTSLATTLTTHGYSLKELLVAIAITDYFDRAPPEAACGASPYSYPNVFDPWVTSDADPERRLNGPGDAVTAIDARTLIHMTGAALEWTPPPHASRFPDYGETGCEDTCSTLQQECNNFGQCCTTVAAACADKGLDPTVEVPFEEGVGVFLRNSEQGFRGLDFQARLMWEDRYARCARPAWMSADFLDRLATVGATTTGATAADLIAALKDRLVGEPTIDDGAERAALEAMIGGPLEAPAAMIGAVKLRVVCGALVASPQYLLQGIAGRGGERPKLTPTDAGYAAACAELAAQGLVTCGDDSLTLTTAARTRTAPSTWSAPVVDRVRRGRAATRRP